jgi:hypothetical protein
MSLYRVTSDNMEPIQRTSFAAENLLERKDLQRFLRDDISPLGDDLMVISEEFGDWDASNRRIDLLCLSKDARRVVVEIKRTEDGGHMELQAIRYAAMVSSMTLDQAIQAYARLRSKEPEDARREVLNFLQPSVENEAELVGEVRIVLVSSDFSTELTSAVLWLNKHDLDITCIRLRPYRMGSEVLIDATQIIPLPEAADYEVKVRAQEKETRKVLSARQDICRKFLSQLIERSRDKTPLLANRTALRNQWIAASIGRSGISLNLVLVQNRSRVECYMSLPGGAERTEAAFQQLKAKKDEIEAAFGGELLWEDLPGRQACRISTEFPGGWNVPESEWPGIQDQMIETLVRLDGAFKKPLQDLII